MSHAINAWLARHLRQILNIGLARDNAIAAAHGWQARQVKPGTWSYRDRGFIYRAIRTSPIGPAPAASSVTARSPTWLWADPDILDR